MKNEDVLSDERFWLWVVFRVIFAIIIAVVVFDFVFSFVLQRSAMMFYPDWTWNLLAVLFFIWLISWIFRWPLHYGRFGYEHEKRILRRRYARGEITEAQFKKMMKVLKEEEHKR